jgi:DNA-binding transcriptional LysR family regulator
MQSLHWSDLQFFLALYRGGSLSAAGRELGVYPSTISRRLTALEESLGTLLFQRTPDGFIPTAAADEIVEAAEVIERQSHLIEERLSGEASALRGRVRIATTDHFAEHFLCAHLPRFIAAYPEIDVEVMTSTGFTDVARGEAEVAIRFAPPDRGAPVPAADVDTITARGLGDMDVGVYVSKEYLRRTGKTAEDPPQSFDVIMPSVSYLPGVEWMREHMSECPVAMRTDGLSPMLAAVRAGLGATVLPPFMLGEFDDLVRLTRPGVVAARTTWVLMPRDLRRVARVRAFVEFFAALMEEERDHFAGLTRASPLRRP